MTTKTGALATALLLARVLSASIGALLIVALVGVGQQVPDPDFDPMKFMWDHRDAMSLADFPQEELHRFEAKVSVNFPIVEERGYDKRPAFDLNDLKRNTLWYYPDGHAFDYGVDTPRPQKGLTAFELPRHMIVQATPELQAAYPLDKLLKPGEFAKLVYPPGEHRFQIKSGEEELCDLVKNLEKSDRFGVSRKYLFNPDKNNRYQTYEAKYGVNRLEGVMEAGLLKYQKDPQLKRQYIYKQLLKEIKLVSSDAWNDVTGIDYVLTAPPESVMSDGTARRTVLARVEQFLQIIDLNQVARLGVFQQHGWTSPRKKG